MVPMVRWLAFEKVTLALHHFHSLARQLVGSEVCKHGKRKVSNCFWMDCWARVHSSYPGSSCQNPKPEGRNPKEMRRSESDEPRCSFGFGLRTSFGFRPSDLLSYRSVEKT